MYDWQSRPDGNYCRVHVQPSQRNRTRNRTIRDSSSSGTVPGSVVRSNPSPCWINREVVPDADQGFPKGSCAHHGCWAHTEWIGNDKSASRRTATDQYRICVTPQDLVTLKWNRGYRQKIAESLYSWPEYGSIRGHLFAQVTHVGLASGSPLPPESCLSCSQPSRCTCEGFRSRLRGYLRCGHALLRRRMGTG
jgi:hypothetical protein